MVAELAAELVAAPLDLDTLAELVAIALVAAVVAEHVTRAPARAGALALCRGRKAAPGAASAPTKQRREVA